MVENTFVDSRFDRAHLDACRAHLPDRAHCTGALDLWHLLTKKHPRCESVLVATGDYR